MTLALASGWVRGEGAARLADFAPRARGLGFASVFASVPPSDAALARAAAKALGVAVAGIGAPPVTSAEAVAAAVEAAVAPASVLRRPLVVLDVGEAVAARGEPAEAAVLRFSRAIHAALTAHAGLALALRPALDAHGLFGAPEMAWLLDDHRSRPLGLWLDPVRAARTGGGAAAVLAWADRFASRVLGVALHGPGPKGEGHAPPEDADADWGTLGPLLPTGAARVLDVGPAAGADAVVDARRRFEEVFRF